MFFLTFCGLSFVRMCEVLTNLWWHLAYILFKLSLSQLKQQNRISLNPPQYFIILIQVNNIGYLIWASHPFLFKQYKSKIDCKSCVRLHQTYRFQRKTHTSEKNFAFVKIPIWKHFQRMFTFSALQIQLIFIYICCELCCALPIYHVHCVYHSIISCSFINHWNAYASATHLMKTAQIFP